MKGALETFTTQQPIPVIHYRPEKLFVVFCKLVRKYGQVELHRLQNPVTDLTGIVREKSLHSHMDNNSQVFIQQIHKVNTSTSTKLSIQNSEVFLIPIQIKSLNKQNYVYLVAILVFIGSADLFTLASSETPLLLLTPLKDTMLLLPRSNCELILR